MLKQGKMEIKDHGQFSMNLPEKIYKMQTKLPVVSFLAHTYVTRYLV